MSSRMKRIALVVAVLVVVSVVGAVFAGRMAAPKAPPIDETWLVGVIEGGGTFRYPSDPSDLYVSFQTWPAAVTITRGIFSCSPTAAEESPMAQTEWRTIGRESYCVTVITGAAAGSVYQEYRYATTRGDDVVSLSFTVQLPQCVNYDEPAQGACTAAQKRFDADVLAASIARTVVR